MEENSKAEYEIQVSVTDSTEDEVDRLTRQLLSELKQTNIDSVKLAKGGETPSGAKGDPVTVGSILIETLPAALPALIALVQAWSARGHGRVVKFKGKGMEFEGTPEEFKQFIAAMEAGRKK